MPTAPAATSAGCSWPGSHAVPQRTSATLGSSAMASRPCVQRTPSRRMAPPAGGATATTGTAPHWPRGARTCGGQVLEWPWRRATPTASPQAVQAGSPEAGPTDVALCSARGDRSPSSGVPAPSPPTRAPARLLTRTTAPSMSQCLKAPGVAQSRFAGKDSARTSTFTDPETALPGATTMGCATTRTNATATLAGPRPTVQSCCPPRTQRPGASR